jgi:recombinational DNA repair protein RecT
MSQTALAVLSTELQSQAVMNNISAALGKDANSPEVKKFLYGAISEIQSRIGGKSDITLCTKQSIIDSLINAATVRLPVDSRKLAHLIPYGNICTFMPDYKGYIYKVKEVNSTVEVTVGIVYKGGITERQHINTFPQTLLKTILRTSPAFTALSRAIRAVGWNSCQKRNWTR